MSAEIVRAACPHDCPDTCGMLVTVEDGVATKIQGDPSMPFTDGTLCTKVAYYLERTYSPDRPDPAHRVKQPIRRVSRVLPGADLLSGSAALPDAPGRAEGQGAEIGRAS